YYGEDYWGLTASDDPFGYAAHGAPPAWSDNGTITPTAAAGSIVFTPDEVIPTLHAMYDNLGVALWGEYGFKDAFNLNEFWWATDYIGIDQGPIVIMIENYLNESVWQRFNTDPDILRGLQKARFESVTAATPAQTFTVEAWTSPNPFSTGTTVSYRTSRTGPVMLELFDAKGRRVRTYEDQATDKGVQDIVVDAADLASGIYFYRLTTDAGTIWKRCVLVK
ncbi:T9SS type A sorting domain-containing protein, partial [bacterium]|nr:T9SS type A sorting domain-containing protein [bacterium]